MNHLICFKTVLATLSSLLIASGLYAAPPEYSIGGAFALSGFASAWGEAERNGATLAVEDFNKSGGISGVPVSLRIEDIESESVATISAVTKLISIDRVPIIVGSTWLDTFAGAVPIAQRHETILISPSASIRALKAKKPFPLVFSTWYRADREAAALLAEFQKRNFDELLLILGDDPFWEQFRAVFKEEANSLGIKIVKDYKIHGARTDFRTMMLKVKKLKPSAIFFGLNDEASIQAFVKQRAELGLTLPVFTTEYIEEYESNPAFNTYLAGIHYVAPRQRPSGFSRKYRTRFKVDPVFSASNSYDATIIALNALKQSEESKTSLSEVLRSGEFETVTFGKVRFDELGGISEGEFEIREVAGSVVEK